jgi:benzoyl-CoA reductase/2-hydroxyglutaryl-CoA dehydratase subunit BcrC/BadD/HgdB
MGRQETEFIGFTCAYTPLALIDAAGFAPYRVLPMGESPDQAGHVLHDNLCPHVKRVLDRAHAGDLPKLAGMVFLNSCDAMRRVSDAWRKVRPEDRVVLLDLPVAADNGSVSYFASELSRLAETLSQWSGRAIASTAVEESLERYNELASLLETVRKRSNRGALEGGAAEMQRCYNRAATLPFTESLDLLKELTAAPASVSEAVDGVPIFIFGNVLPDPEALGLFESCGVRVVGEDLCTGSRLFHPLDLDGSGGLYSRLARGLLSRPLCARTFDSAHPGRMADDVVTSAKACNARGVIGYTIKFCDPCISRLPRLREVLRAAGLPYLQIEGDCTMGSVGQQRTRIEAFIEMLR